MLTAPTASTPPAAPTPPAVEARAPEAKPRDVRAADAVRMPDKQTVDARALADVMSADSRTRTPTTLAPATRAPATATSDSRTATASANASTGPSAGPPSGPIVLARGEVDGALADFARLATALRGSFSASGLTIDAMSEGTIFQRAGLRAGDVVTAVDGAPLRSLDDAANLYARASTARALTAQVVRGGKPMTIYVTIQ